jgi:hypothetical protein
MAAYWRNQGGTSVPPCTGTRPRGRVGHLRPVAVVRAGHLRPVAVVRAGRLAGLRPATPRESLTWAFIGR